MRRLDRLPLKPLAAAIVFAAPQLAYSQLEEIVVTAERREASELETAISVEVFTMDQLNLDKLQTVDDLQNMTPNLTVNYAGFTIQSVNIRGVGNAVGNPNIQPGVVVMKDGMIAGETVVIQQGFLDIETIEVLRGPQGTFVGQASTGGAVAINSARPNFDGVNGWVEARFGDYADTKLAGAVNVPLTENISSRFAFSNETRDGYWNNNYNQINGFGPGNSNYFEVGVHPGNMDSTNFRASFLWEPSDDFSILGRAEFNTIQTDHVAAYVPNWRTYNIPAQLGGGTGQARYASFTESVLQGQTSVGVPPADPYTLSYDWPEAFQESTTNLYSLEIVKTFNNGVTFRSETGYQDNDLRVSEDIDGTRLPAQQRRIDVGPDNDYYNQQFFLIGPEENRLRWLAGAAFYHRFTPVQNTNFASNCGADTGNPACTGLPPDGNFPNLVVYADVFSIQRHQGVFGQVLYDLTDNLELEVGARFSWDRNINFLDVWVGAPGAPNVAGCPDGVRFPGDNLPEGPLYGCVAHPVSSAPAPASGLPSATPNGSRLDYDEEEPTWKLGLNWSPGDNHFIYGFLARGYKSGGTDAALRFFNEVVDDYEFGYKGTLLDGRMQIQAGIYYMDYQNMQQEVFTVNTDRPSDADGIVNIGDSTIQGFELEIDAAFGNFGLNFGAGIIDSELGEANVVDARFVPGNADIGGSWYRGCLPGESENLNGNTSTGCFDYGAAGGLVNLAGQNNLYSPELTWNVAVDYQFQLDNGAAIRPRLSYSYSDEQFAALFQSDPYYSTEERELINFSISYERDDWQAYLYCTNCTEESFVSSVVIQEPSRIVYNFPRTVGVRFRKDF